MHNLTNITSTLPPVSTVASEHDIRTVRLCFYVVTFVTGLIGNILVVVIINKKAKRSVHQMFILNLAISDLTFLVFCLPAAIYGLYETIYKSDFFCRFVFPVQTITYFTSIFTITSMAVFRCYVIVNPYKPKMADRSAHIWISLIWIVSLVFVTPLSIINETVNGECVEDWPSLSYRKAYTLALFLLQFLLPLCVIAVAYIWLGVYLVKNKGPETTIGNKKKGVNLAKKRRENMQIITTLAAIVTMFTICLLPGQIAWMIMDLGTPDQLPVALEILKFSDIPDFIHACVNPIAYGLLTDAFRRDYKWAFAVLSKFITCGQTTITPGRIDESTVLHVAPNTPTIHLRPTIDPVDAISADSRSSSRHTRRSSSVASNVAQYTERSTLAENMSPANAMRPESPNLL